MSRLVANVDIVNDSFQTWLDSSNELLNSLSTEIITANTTLGTTGNTAFPRNALLIGTFGSNTVYVNDVLRGGNTASSANLYVSTNTNIGNSSTSTAINLMVSNSTSYTVISPIAGNFGNTTANSIISTSSIITQSSSIVNTNITSTQIKIANSSANSILTTNSLTLGNTTVNSVLAPSNLAIYDHIIDVTSNGNIGSSTSTPILIYSFPKTSYSSGKVMAQLKNTGNTQISEMVVAHDLTSAYISVYGTVSSPPSATTDASLLGIFSAAINNANVEIYVKQVVSSTAVKVVANLIK